MPVDPFSIDPPSNLLSRAALTVARPLLSALLSFDSLRTLYAEATQSTTGSFADRALQALGVKIDCASDCLSRVPTAGPLIVAANHPCGALDGLILAALIGRARSDVRLLANYWLARIPEMAESCFFVDPFEGDASRARSLAGLRAAHLWLRRGGTLVMFPSGEVARKKTCDATVDSEWKTTVGRLALQTGATVLPTFIDGANSQLFYRLGRLHSVVGTALLPRELLRQRGKRVAVAIAPPIMMRSLAKQDAFPEALTKKLRAEVDRLAGADAPSNVGQPNERDIACEVSQLPEDYRLVESGAYEVFCVPASYIPHTLREIGRLRAVTYRAAGEGTHAAVDLDAFDAHYLHLFCWDRDKRRIVGAYRLGESDRIVREYGIERLYTRTLFEYDCRLLAKLPSPALELGRSFVRIEYQRQHQALLLLWKGIGRFVVRHPKYRTLFGPVSISARYSDASHSLLASFLAQNHLDSGLAELVRAKHPLTARPSPHTVTPGSIEDVDHAIAAMESDGKGMPILLRQYLKLGARAIGLSVDPSFGDVLDAMVVVDLAAIDLPLLRRYLGRDGAAAFLAHHRAGESPRAA